MVRTQAAKAAAARPLPTEWALSARPVFGNDERRIYRQLREALPHHIVLAKLPLVRFCQPDDPQQVRYWYELLGAIHVTYAVCSANGRVLAAIDLANDRNAPTRPTQIKQTVLAACRVRYLRCPVDVLLRRIRMRARAIETGISPEYLRQVFEEIIQRCAAVRHGNLNLGKA